MGIIVVMQWGSDLMLLHLQWSVRRRKLLAILRIVGIAVCVLRLWWSRLQLLAELR